jgi:AcrR family transcriptional regulator
MAMAMRTRLRNASRKPREYRQERRARQTDANTDRIVNACVRLLTSARHVADIALDDIARQSGLTVRTILRRFGSRDGVLEAAFGHLQTEFKNLRPASPPGDVDAAIASLLDQYEQIGDLNIRALEQEDQLPVLHRNLELARRYHRGWLRDVFGPQLSSLVVDERERRITTLYAATDIYLWKLLRRDLKLDRDETEDIFERLVRGALTQSRIQRAKREGRGVGRTR